MTTYTLTSAPATLTLSLGDTLTIPFGTLVQGDDIVGSGSNEIILGGPADPPRAAFDLTVPGTLTGFSSLVEAAAGQTLTLRSGLPLAVTGAGDETVTFANGGDSFDGGSTGSNYIFATTALMNAGAAVNGGTGGGNVLGITDSGVVITPAGYDISNVQNLLVNGDNDTVNSTESSIPTVILNGTGDQTALTAAVSVYDYSSGNTVQFTTQDGTLNLYLPSSDSPAQNGPQTVTATGFAATDAIDIENLATLTSTTFSSNDQFEIVGTDASGNLIDDVVQLQGNYIAGDFTLTATNGGAGYVLTTSDTPSATFAYLTTGEDTVTGAVSNVIATDSTLSPGDVITPNAGAELDLQGAGTFDLTAPATLTGIGQIVAESSNATITMLNGLPAPLTLSAAGDDTVFLADSEGAIDANGGANDSFYATGYQAETETIAAGPYSDLAIDAPAQSVNLSPNITGLAYVTLDGGSTSFNPGPSGPNLVYVDPDFANGNDVVQLTGLTTAAVDNGTSFAGLPDNYFFTPGGGDVLTVAYASAPPENLFGFDSSSQVVLEGFSSIDPATGLTVAADTALGGAPGVLVTVTGVVNGTTATESLQLYGDYNSNDFTLTAIPGGTTYELQYTGSVPVDTGSQAGNSISGVADIYLASGQLQGGDHLSTTPGGTLYLIGAGSFTLNEAAAAITGVSQIAADGPDQTITLDSRMGNETLNIGSYGGPAGHDIIYNLTDATTVVDNGYGYNLAFTTSDQVNGLNVDLGGGNGATSSQIGITDEGYSLTLDAPKLQNVETFYIVENGGISFDTGAYSPTSGQSFAPVNVDIGIGGGTLAGDSVTVRGNDDTVTDFSMSNTITLLGSNETIYIDSSTPGATDTISGFDQGASTNDAIDYSSADKLQVSSSVNAGETTLTIGGDVGGNPLSQTLVLDGDYTGTFSVQSDQNDGLEVVYAPEVACFCKGAQLRTPTGEAAVETVQEGDLVTTLSGVARPIRWIGSAKVMVPHGRRSPATPVIVRRGALADNVPSRDLHLTKGHSLFIDGVLIPAEFLVNHRSIVWDDAAREVEVYHIELETHDILVVDGAPAESYRDDGNRWMFQNDRPAGNDHRLAPFAAVVTGGPIVDAVWTRLLRRSGQALDLATTLEPDLHITIADRRVSGRCLDHHRFAFDLPSPTAEVSIVSRSGRQDELGLHRDPRMLGVALSQIVIWRGHRPTVLAAAELEGLQGFHSYEIDGDIIWTNGEAVLPAHLTAGADALVLSVKHTARYHALLEAQRRCA